MIDFVQMFEESGMPKKHAEVAAFFYGLQSGLTEDLDKKYAGELPDGVSYEKLLENVKAAGFRVFRNSEGKHRLLLVPEKFTIPNL